MDVAELQLKADAGQIDKADRSLDKLDKTAARTEKSTNRLNKENDKTASSYANMQKSMKVATGALLAVGTASLVLRKSISIIKDFEVAMDTVGAISRATADEMVKMTAVARELGAKTSFSATQAAEGMKFLAQAGFTASESVAAIPGVLNLARASAMDLGTAADIASNVMSGFGIAAENSGYAVDILAGISSRANTNVFQLGEAASYVGPVARAMGIDLGTASAAIGVLSDAGIQGSSAGTGLRRVLSSLANPTKDAADIIKDLGLTLDEVNPATNNLTDIIDRLAGTGLSAADALTIFGDRGGPAILALTANAPRVAELAREMEGVTGEAQRMSDEMGDNLTGDTLELTSALSELAIQLGDAGVTGGMRYLTQSATETVRVFGFLIDETQALFDIIKNTDYVRLAEAEAKLQRIIEHKTTIQNSPVSRFLLGDQTTQLDKLNEQLADVQSRMNKIINLGPELTQTFAGGLPELNKRLAEAGGLIDNAGIELQKMWRLANGDEARKATEAAEEFADAIQAIKDAADPTQAEVDKLKKEFELMDKALAEGLVTAEEYSKFMDYALPEVVVNARKVTASVKEIDVASNALTISFERGIERMRDGFGDFFEDLLVNGKASLSDLGDLFKRTIAEMVATAAANQIFIGLGLVGASGSASAGGAGGGAAAVAGSTLGSAGSAGSLLSGASTISSAFSGASAFGMNAYAGAADFLRGAGLDSMANAASGQAGAYGSLSNTGALAYGAANIGAGIVGAYAGQAAFGGNTTGVGSAVGGTIGSIYGPIGTAIGSFLGEGLETALGNVLGFGGNSNNRVYADINGGEVGNSYHRDKGSHSAQYSAVNAAIPAIQEFLTATGNTTFNGQISASAKHGLEYNGLKTNDMDQFLRAVFGDIVKESSMFSDFSKGLLAEFKGGTEEFVELARALSVLSDAIESSEITERLIKQFDGSTEDLIAYANALAGISALLEENPVTAAMKEIEDARRASSMTTMELYDIQIEAIKQLTDVYSGSVVATQQLGEALQSSQQAAYQMALGIETIRTGMLEMFGDSAKTIRESVMTEAQLYRHYEDERDRVGLEAAYGQDPIEVQAALVEWNRLNNELFNMLNNPSARDAEEFATLAEAVAGGGEMRLDQMLARLEETQATQMDNVAAALEASVARQEAWTGTFAEAIQNFVNGLNNSNNGSEITIQ